MRNDEVRLERISGPYWELTRELAHRAADLDYVAGCAPCGRLLKLGLGAAVARGGALKRECTKLISRSVEERASVHGTVGLLVVIGEW